MKTYDKKIIVAGPVLVVTVLIFWLTFPSMLACGLLIVPWMLSMPTFIVGLMEKYEKAKVVTWFFTDDKE